MNGNDATVYNLEQHTPKSVINVAVLGAESTGKTTLCRDLAEHFDTPWVSEYMRTYLQANHDEPKNNFRLRGRIQTFDAPIKSSD